MKNEKQSRVGKVFNRIFNVRQWSDFDRMRAGTLYLGRGIRRLFVPEQVESLDKQKTFTETAKELNLTKEALAVKQKSLLRLSIWMFIIGICLLIYAVYNFINGHFSAAMLSLVVMGIAWVMAFRYHFWYFQIKERRLGCSIREWYTHFFLGGRHEKNRR